MIARKGEVTMCSILSSNVRQRDQQLKNFPRFLRLSDLMKREEIRDVIGPAERGN